MKFCINAFFFFLELALSPNSNEVHIYEREDDRWSCKNVLSQHDLRVTSIDWAPNTNRIVTCSAVSVIDTLLNLWQ